MSRAFGRSIKTYDDCAVVQQKMATELVAVLMKCAGGKAQFNNVLELGCGTGLLTAQLIRTFRIERLILNDIAPQCELTMRKVRSVSQKTDVTFLPGDMESVALPARQDLVASSACVHWANDLRSLIEKLSAAIQNGALLAVSTFGPDNCTEFSQVTRLGLNYWSCARWESELSAKFEVLCVEEWHEVLQWPSAVEILRHLKKTGVNGISRRKWSPAWVRSLCRSYEEKWSSGGMVRLTYHPILIVARRRSKAR